MATMYEIDLSDEKFSSLSVLNDILISLNSVSYCVIGSFLSALHFQRPFSGSFDILVHDENEVYELIGEKVKLDRVHGVASLSVADGMELSRALKLRIVDTSAKNSLMRNYLVENSESKTCIVRNAIGEVEKIDIPIPKRGPTIISLLIEMDDTSVQVTSTIEKIVWSLTNIGVAPLLRETRFVQQECINIAADKIEDLFVTHANKTISMLHVHATGPCRTITSAELKKLGRPYAALLRA